MNRRAIVLALAAVLSAVGSPALAKARPITALAPVEIVLDGQHELVGVAVAPDDSVYVSDRKAGRVLRLAPSGQLTVAAHGLEEPRGLATTGAGLLIAETKAGRVLRLEPSGALTILASGIRNPRALAAAPGGSGLGRSASCGAARARGSGGCRQKAPPVVGIPGRAAGPTLRGRVSKSETDLWRYCDA